MIRIEQVKINNFRNFDGEYKFDFSKDVTIFLGDNGNGKSSIFDAIQWCLTGSIERFNDIPNLETLKNVLINKNTNDCFVEIKFTDNTILKRIISRKGKVLVRCLDANNNSIKSDKNVKQYLEKAFKATSSSSFDVNNFMKSSLLAQDQVLDFIASDSANERYKVLSSILGMDDITSLKTNYEQVKNILKIEIDKKYNLVTSRKEELKLQKSNIDNKYTNINIEDSNNFNIKDKQTEKDRLLENKFQAERNLKEFNSQAKNIDKYIEDLNLISENISTLNSKNQELQNQQEKIMKVLVLNKKDLKENDKFIQ
ncbi:AAA family ATPase, partial [Lactococcus lactis]